MSTWLKIHELNQEIEDEKFQTNVFLLALVKEYIESFYR